MDATISTQGDKYTFQDLILNRVHEILLIASPYDAFVMEEDGGLTEQILLEYIGMNFSYAPRIWRTDTAAQAMDMLQHTKIDLVIVMMRISDMDPLSIAAKIKQTNNSLPIVLLTFDESELKQLPENLIDTSIDHIFIWSGNANVFLAIVKHIEDKMNIKRDVSIGNIRCIILIEDRPRYYSMILPLIYKEITRNTKHLMDKSLNDTERILHMRARPKILLATTYEQAQNYFNEYQNNTLGIISDIRFPKSGIHDKNAGQDFVRWARSKDPSIPILLQSTHQFNAELAKELHVNFIHKKSKTLMQDLRKFIIDNFGFGDFIFKTPSGKVIDRVTNLEGLKNAIKTIPKKSIEYHAGSNHFSNWLAARGEFILASKIRPINYREFDSYEDHRDVLVSLIDESIKSKKQTRVIEFSSKHFDPTKNFVRLCPGSLGGKARGLAFINSLIDDPSLVEAFPNVLIRVPKAFIIATTEFENFIEENNLYDKALKSKDDKQVNKLFQKASLSKGLKKSLRAIIKELKFPIAVRSSSLLEDSQYQPLAGMYATYMLPNNDKNRKVVLDQLCIAIKRVYASMFYKDTLSLIDSSVHSLEEEKMAVIIMELVGQNFENRFYPTFSGTAQSFNYYPVSYMERDEGVAYVALGLGRTIADGEKSLRFSPKYPAILPQYFSVKATLASSQNSFYALNMIKKPNRLLNSETDNLDLFDLSTAEKDNVLSWVASVVSSQDNIVRDSLKHKGTRVITFAPILRFGLFPLDTILDKLLQMGKRALGCEVEMEFAVNLFKDGRKPEFCILQIKPMVLGVHEELIHEIDLTKKENVFCKSALTLGNGHFSDIQDIIFVDPEQFDPANSQLIAKEIDTITQLLPSKISYILIGPGRWGTADPWLGIPIKWQQISQAKVIVEVGIPEFPVDPSFGSHFFQNVTSMRLGYFTINHKSMTDMIDLHWLKSLEIVKELKYTKWIRTDWPMNIIINGLNGEGHVLKPIPDEPEVMDEEEASGI
ncbi:MAG: PEP/pyruvate-binding domain-containing protein [Fidelibacterota bacterium]